MFAPLIRSSPSSAILTSTPGQRLADRAELVVLGPGARGDRRGLGHAVALHDRDAAAPEELEDLARDRRGAGDGLAHAPAEEAAHELGLRGHGRRTARAASSGTGSPRTSRSLIWPPTRADELQLLGRQLLLGQRVELLEDARHRRQVGRLDLHQLADDGLGVAAEVGDRRAAVDRAELDEQRERVRERQEEVDESSPSPPNSPRSSTMSSTER